MPAPTSNIKIADVYAELGISQSPPLSMNYVHGYNLINADGLDPTYCPGSTPAARLFALQSTPHNFGYWRGYDHNAHGSLYAIPVIYNTAGTPCNQFNIATTVYCIVSTLASAYAANLPIWANAQATISAPSAWYSDDNGAYFYQWDINIFEFISAVGCLSNLTYFPVMGPFRDPCNETSKEFDAWLSGAFNTPMTGMYIYVDAQGTIPLDAGNYSYDTLNGRQWFTVGANGLITAHGKCL